MTASGSYRRVPIPPALRKTSAKPGCGASHEAVAGDLCRQKVLKNLIKLAGLMAGQVNRRNRMRMMHSWSGALKLAAMICDTGQKKWFPGDNANIQRLNKRFSQTA